MRAHVRKIEAEKGDDDNNDNWWWSGRKLLRRYYSPTHMYLVYLVDRFL